MLISPRDFQLFSHLGLRRDTTNHIYKMMAFYAIYLRLNEHLTQIKGQQIYCGEEHRGEGANVLRAEFEPWEGNPSAWSNVPQGHSGLVLIVDNPKMPMGIIQWDSNIPAIEIRGEEKIEGRGAHRDLRSTRPHWNSTFMEILNVLKISYQREMENCLTAIASMGREREKVHPVQRLMLNSPTLDDPTPLIYSRYSDFLTDGVRRVLAMDVDVVNGRYCDLIVEDPCTGAVERVNSEDFVTRESWVTLRSTPAYPQPGPYYEPTPAVHDFINGFLKHVYDIEPKAR